MTINIPSNILAGSILPAGPAGAPGATGPQGQTGPQGAQGATGSAGAAGPASISTPIPWTSGLSCIVGPPATSVFYSGILYICTTSHISGSVFDPTKWQQWLQGAGQLLAGNNLGDVSNASTALSNLGGAPLASPAFTGTPTAPTPAAADNSTKLATTAWVQGGFVSISAAATYSNGMINKFRNGTMDVAQRGASGSVSAGSTAYTLDGWMIAATGAAAAWSQQYAANLAGNGLRISRASGLTACTLQQRIESYIASDLLTYKNTAQPVTIQFAIYNNTGATITPQLAVGYASAQDNFATVTSDLAATNLQSIANGAYGIVSYTYTPNAGISKGMQIQLLFGGALNGSSGYVDIAFADIRATPGGTTGLNSNPPPPEVRPIWSELAFSQRYFQTTYGNGVAPGAATHNGMVGGGTYVSGDQSSYTAIFPVQMRATPSSLSYWDGAGNPSKVSTLVSGSFTDNVAETTFPVVSSPTGFSAYNATNPSVYFHYTASSEL